MKIVSDSMRPILESGSVVAIRHAQKTFKTLDGKIAAFRRDGDETIKWLKLMAENLDMALPENRQSKEIYSFRGEETDQTIIVGNG
jgi:phage repressor protein C with HTH and peptisase S24 domain